MIGRMSRGDQLARQWRLLHLLDRPAGVSVDDAARDLGCTVRTIWRDLRVLEGAGFPIYDEPGAAGRRSLWKIQEEFRLGLPLKLSLAEVAALVMSRDLLAASGTGAISPSVTSAFQKVSRVLSKDARALLEQMRETPGVRALGAKLQEPAAPHLQLIQTALLEHRQLEMQYYSVSRDETTRRRVDPYHLTLFSGGFYLVGYCHLRRALRIFAVERVRELRALSSRFDLPTNFKAEEYLREAWGIVKGDVVTVEVIFSRAAARDVRGRLWHPSQRLREMPGGRLELTLKVADTLEVRRWILGYGPDAEVMEPAALREALRQEALALGEKLVPLRRPSVAAPPLAISARRRPSRKPVPSEVGR